MKFNLKTWQAIFIIIVLGLILLLMPIILRYLGGAPLISDQEFYRDISLSSNSHFVSNYVLNFIFPVVGMNGLIIISLVLGILSLGLFYLLTKDLFNNKNHAFFSSLIFACSPIFIYLFTTFNELSVGTTLVLLLFVLVRKRNYFSIFVFALIPFVNVSFFFITLILVSLYLFFDRDKSLALKLLTPGILITVCLTIFVYKYFIFDFKVASLSSYFLLFGVDVGISFFLLCLGLLGFLTAWNRTPSYKYWLFVFIMILFLSFFSVSGMIFFNFILSAFTAVFIIFLLSKDWEILSIRNFTILLVFCGVIFSSTVMVDNIINSQPSAELVDSFVFLNMLPEANVLSHPNNGFLINYFSKQEAFLLPDDSINNAKDLFFSRNSETVISYMKDTNIKYILVTSEMTQGSVWEKEDEGLLFLLNHDSSFQELYSKNTITIWELVE